MSDPIEIVDVYNHHVAYRTRDMLMLLQKEKNHPFQNQCLKTILWKMLQKEYLSFLSNFQYNYRIFGKFSLEVFRKDFVKLRSIYQ